MMHAIARWWWVYFFTLSFLLSGCGGNNPPSTPVPPVPVPAPPPIVVPVPPPAADPLRQRGDFRNFRCQGEFYLIGEQEFPRPECLAEYVSRGYTDVWVTVTRDGGLPGIEPYDYLADAPRFRARAERFRAAGLRVSPVIGCEDAEQMCRDHHGEFPAWLDAVGEFVAGTHDIASSYVLGVEIREWVTWDQSIALVHRVGQRSINNPIIPHFNQGQWGPSSTDPWSGGGQLAYWRRLQIVAEDNPLVAGIQYRHEDVGDGFLASHEEVAQFTAALLARLPPSIPINASEYAYRVAESEGIDRGNTALRAGASSCMNGCSEVVTPDPIPGVPWPDTAWALADLTPTQRAALERIRPVGVMIAIQHGKEVWRFADPYHHETNWASVARSYVTTAWVTGMELGHVIATPETFVRDLGTPTAERFDPRVQMKHLLSYTSCFDPPGSRWRYSCGDHWPWQHALFQEATGLSVADYLNREVFSVIGGLTAVTTSDTTARIHGNPADHARWAYLWLNGGRWREHRLIATELVNRATSGGPDGDGAPNPLEGWQIHLIRDGVAWELDFTGVPDGFMARAGGSSHEAVVVIPSLNLIVVAKGSSPVTAFMRQLVAALEQ